MAFGLKYGLLSWDRSYKKFWFTASLEELTYQWTYNGRKPSYARGRVPWDGKIITQLVFLGISGETTLPVYGASFLNFGLEASCKFPALYLKNQKTSPYPFEARYQPVFGLGLKLVL